jgi:hypothetical protein
MALFHTTRADGREVIFVADDIERARAYAREWKKEWGKDAEKKVRPAKIKDVADRY